MGIDRAHWATVVLHVGTALGRARRAADQAEAWKRLAGWSNNPSTDHGPTPTAREAGRGSPGGATARCHVSSVITTEFRL